MSLADEKKMVSAGLKDVQLHVLGGESPQQPAAQLIGILGDPPQPEVAAPAYWQTQPPCGVAPHCSCRC